MVYFGPQYLFAKSFLFGGEGNLVWNNTFLKEIDIFSYWENKNFPLRENYRRFTSNLVLSWPNKLLPPPIFLKALGSCLTLNLLWPSVYPEVLCIKPKFLNVITVCQLFLNYLIYICFPHFTAWTPCVFQLE